MKKLQNYLESFIETNDMSKLSTTIAAMAIRDCKNNPELYQESEIENDIVEVLTLIGTTQREVQRIQLSKLTNSNPLTP